MVAGRAGAAAAAHHPAPAAAVARGARGAEPCDLGRLAAPVESRTGACAGRGTPSCSPCRRSPCARSCWPSRGPRGGTRRLRRRPSTSSTARSGCASARDSPTLARASRRSPRPSRRRASRSSRRQAPRRSPIAAVGRARRRARRPAGERGAADLAAGDRARRRPARRSRRAPRRAARAGEGTSARSARRQARSRIRVVGSPAADQGLFARGARCGIGPAGACEVVATLRNGEAVAPRRPLRRLPGREVRAQPAGGGAGARHGDRDLDRPAGLLRAAEADPARRARPRRHAPGSRSRARPTRRPR